MVVDAGTGRFLSQRDTPRLCLIQVELFSDWLYLKAPGMDEHCLQYSSPAEGSVRRVSVWDSHCLGVDQGDAVARWLSEFLAKPCRLVRIPPSHRRRARKGTALVGYADGYSALVVSEASLADLNKRLVAKVPMQNLRPNVVVRGSEAYAEDEWPGLRIGSLSLVGHSLCARCSTVCTHQRTGLVSAEPNKTLAKYRSGRHLGRTDVDHAKEIYFGRYFNHANQGHIRIGDEVRLVRT